MGALWIVYGLWGNPEAYFVQPLTFLDFWINCAMIVGYFYNQPILNQLRFFRLLKLPGLLLLVTNR